MCLGMACGLLKPESPPIPSDTFSNKAALSGPSQTVPPTREQEFKSFWAILIQTTTAILTGSGGLAVGGPPRVGEMCWYPG